LVDNKKGSSPDAFIAVGVPGAQPMTAAVRGPHPHRRPAARHGGWLSLIAAILAGMPRLPGALCVGDRRFDGRSADDAAAAVAVCHQCPALQCCAEWLNSTPKYRRPTGVIAGVYRRTRDDKSMTAATANIITPKEKIMNSQNGLVPLALLATELEIDIAALAQQFGDDVVPDAAGLRCVPIERCREYIAATHAARRADEERMQTQIAECVAGIDRMNAPVQAMLEAIAAQPAAEPGVPAIAAMVANDPDIGFNRRGRHMDEMLGGENTYHKVQED
jgi:hypothetical protein